MVRNVEDWKKLLFLPQRKLQTAELNEIQEVMLSHSTSAFNSLYSSVYSVVRGFDISFIRYTDQLCELFIKEGVIRFKTDHSYFVTIPSQTVYLPLDSRSFINLQIDVAELSNVRDEVDGQHLFGSKGADRQYYTVDTVINEDGWPLAFVDTFDVRPVVYNFFEDSFQKDYLLTRLPKQIENTLFRVFYEQSGNFIANGLDLILDSISLESFKVRVHEGVAYINGRRVNVNFTQHFSFSTTVFEETSYLYFYVDSRGLIFYRPYLMSKSSKNWLCLGSVSRSTFGLSAVSSNNRAISNKELDHLEQMNKQLQQSYKEVALNYRSLSLNNVNLIDTFISTFADLNQSDIYSYLFNCSISLKQQFVTLPKQSRTFLFKDMQLLEQQAVNVYNNWLIPASTEYKLIDQPQATDWLSVSTRNTASATIFLSPSFSVPNTQEIQYQVLYDGQLTVNLNATQIQLEGLGFKDQEGLKITFGSVVLNDFEVLEGTAYSVQDGTFSARSDGYIKVRFYVPNNLAPQNYVVTVSNSNVSASYVFRKLADTTISPVNRTVDIGVSDQSVAQSFTLNEPTVLKSGELFFRSINNPKVLTVLGAVHIVPVVGNVPQANVLATAYVYSADVLTTNNGSLGTPFYFDKPVYLNEGQFALVFCSYVEGVEMYSSSVKQSLLSSNTNLGASDFVGGSLFTYSNNTWIENLQSDLTFNLKAFKFLQTASSAVFRLQNPLETFRTLSTYLEYIRPTGTLLEVYYKTANQSNWATLSPNQTLDSDVSFVDFKIQFTSTANVSSFVNLDYYVVTNSFADQGVWISKTVEMSDFYSSVSVELNQFVPESASVSVYISSNSGQTWTQLDKENEQLVDGRVPLYRVKYSKNVGDTDLIYINGKDTTFKRRNLTVRVDLESENVNSLPYFTNVVASVL